MKASGNGWKLLAAGVAMTAATPAFAANCMPTRAMSFNIRLDVKSDGDNRWSMRREQFIGQILLMRPDILGLQEVVPSQKRDLEQAMPQYLLIGGSREGSQDRGEYSPLAIARERWRIKESGTFWLSETPDRPSKGWDAAFPRIATWARLVRKADKKRFLAINTHLDHIGEVAKVQGARQIATFIASARKSREAVIMLGDLNSTPDSTAVSELLNGPAGLRDSRASSESPPIGPEGTFNAFNPLPQASKRIDYVLHDASLRAMRHATMAWHGENGRVASDHFAVLADLIDERCTK